MQPYMSSPIFVLLLTRLQTAKTDKFSQGLLKLIAFAAAIQKSDLSPDQVVGFVDGVQPGLVLFFFARVILQLRAILSRSSML